MFIIVLITGFCYIVGGAAIILGFAESNAPAVMSGIGLVLSGVLFHAINKGLDYLQDIKIAVQKMAEDEK